ncbi:unnamed protein product [Lymnaea stagnalis]|uniref:Uncharacterized protein n=1 Tax=Lymnaea stagnalis TaxID=6523 RepID=A0AAV2HP92_LYMST
MTSPWHVSLILLLVFSSSVNVRSQATIEHDVIFFIDGSLSVTNTNFRKQINAVFAKYIDQWPVSEDGVHVGFIAYSSQLDVVHLNGNTTELAQKTQNLIYEGRASNAHLAFEQALIMFTSAHSIRSGSVQSIIMLTDGTVRLPLDTRTAAEACRDYGVNIYVIGIGSNVRLLESLWYTGNISRVYNNDTFDDVLPAIDIGLPAAVPTSVTSTIVVSTGIQSSQSTSTVSPNPRIDSSGSTQTAQTSTSTPPIPSSSSINVGPTSTSTQPIPQPIPSSSSINVGSTTTLTQPIPSSSSINEGPTTTSSQPIPSSSSINVGPTTTSTQPIPSSSSINVGSTTTSTQPIPSSSSINVGPISTSTQPIPSSSSINLSPTTASTPFIQSTSSINSPTAAPTQPFQSSPSIKYSTTPTPTQVMQSSSSMWSSTTLATLQSTSTTSTTPPKQSPYTTLPLTTTTYNQPSSPIPSRSDLAFSTSRLASTGYPHTTTPVNPSSIVPTSTYSVTPTASTPPDDDDEPGDDDTFNVTDEAGICARAVKMNSFLFAPHPDDCDKYIQCHVSQDRRITASVRACPRGLFWNQAKFACDKPGEECNRECRDPCRGKDDGDTYKMEGGCGLFWECVDGVAQGRSCKPRYAFIPGHGCVYRPECRYVDIRRRRCDATCDLTPNEDNTKFIIPLKTGWLTSSCLFGTEFDLASCSCRANENFDKDCPYMAWMDGASEAYNTTSDNNDTSVAPAGPMCESRVLIHHDSNRPLAIRFRYRYSDDGDDDDNATSSPQAQVLVRSRECQKGGTCSLVDDGSNLSLEIVSGNGIFVSSSIPLLGLNQTAWRDVRVVYSKGEITMEITVGQLTYTSYIKGDPHIQVGVCGWDVGKAGDLENYGDFTGDIQQVQISRCFDYGI